jgi:LAO/AO transport system kinase
MAQPLHQRVLAGDRGAVARALRLVDDRHPSGPGLVGELFRAARGAHVVGITGGPGAGKSSLADRLIESYRTRGDRVGVVAIDPSSPFSGGAVLGDRIRMQRHAADDGVFIRSFAARGHLGGLCPSVRDALVVLAAGGFRTILLETVGVGQGEVEVARVADTVVLVAVPGGGDAVQTLKAGILEIADLFAVNKMDLPGADRVVHDLEQMLALGESIAVGGPDRRRPPVVPTCAHDGRGIDDLVAAVDAHRDYLHRTPAGRVARAERARAALLDALRERIAAEFLESDPEAFARAVERLVEGEGEPHGEAAALIARRPGR